MGELKAVFGVFGFYLILSALMGLTTYGESSNPDLPGNQGDITGSDSQSIGFRVLECVFTFGFKCSEKAETKVFKTIENIFNWAFGTVAFMFQIFTFQIEAIPTLLNFVLIVPAAFAMVYLALSFVRGRAVT